MKKKDANSKTELLANQKLSSRKKIGFKCLKPSKNLIYIATLFIMLAFIPYGLSYLPKVNSSIHISSRQWDHEKLEKQLTTKVKDKTFKDFKAVKQITKKIQRNVSASQVHLFRTKWDQVIADFSFYKPVAGIFLGSPRLVSSDSKVFGIYDEAKHSQLPYIKGIEIANELIYLDDNSMRISEKNLRLIQEALLLIELGISYNINYKTILFDPYRGFAAMLRGKRIRVEMGRSPFENRYKKLEKILAALEKKKVHTARIELDFPGKAFIKEF